MSRKDNTGIFVAITMTAWVADRAGTVSMRVPVGVVNADLPGLAASPHRECSCIRDRSSIRTITCGISPWASIHGCCPRILPCRR
ncbi:hypothetical protein MPL3356_150165 [Mesorhizobium plurifarium]|uniref:Uncharacterized protein n=1 Tax=Mesorhizobium plurifarium TaxID=69974 RepID=A0A090DJK2_MESPL|nr:hypothetical protein MPL3356_150165 [Mesorhizobium plurifarium]